jgi:hypothetical protein
MSAVVFLGPSLPRSEATRLLPDAIFLPPARQSDVISALTTWQPTVIALIDGEFHQARSVWHKELLYVLEQGIPLYGCSSMGALRAAELESFGMCGRGDVFARYASGEFVDDDEVALAYHEDDGLYRTLSEPMVNIRATVDAAVAGGVISTDTAATVITTSKSLDYPDRYRSAVLRQMRADHVDESEVTALELFWRDHAVDIKAADARELLHELHDGVGPTQRVPTLVRTESIDTLLEREQRIRVGGREIALTEIADHVNLHHPDRESTTTASLNRGLALTLAAILDVTPTPAEISREKHLWRARHHLTRDGDFVIWLQRNHLSAVEFDLLAAQEARCRKLHRWLLDTRGARGSTALLLDLLRWAGTFGEWADSAAVCADLADSAEARVPAEVQRSRDYDLPTLTAMHERDVGVTVGTDSSTAVDYSGFLSPEDLAHALSTAAAARIELRHMLRQAAGTARESALVVPDD